VIGIRVYAAPLPDGSAALVVSPAAVRDLLGVGRLLAAHPGRLRIDVLTARQSPAVEAKAAVALVRRAACAATFPPVTGRRRPASLPPLRGPWYAALVTWGWLALLTAGQSVAGVLGGLWLAVGFPWVRGAVSRRADAEWIEPASWLAVALEGTEMRTVVHDGLTRLDQVVRGQQGESAAADAFRRAAATCATAGLSELAPLYLAFSAGHRPAEIWTHAGPAVSPGTDQTEAPDEVERPVLAGPEKPGENGGTASVPAPAQEGSHELL
jgi:hypothetical protein